MKIQFRIIAAVAAIVAAGSVVQAQTFVYQNTGTDATKNINLTNGVVIGQEINLNSANLAAAPYLTNFSFEFYSTNTSFAGTPQMDVKFYKNDGTTYNGYARPGTLFYESGYFNLVAPLSFTSPAGYVGTYVFDSTALYTGVGSMSTSLTLPQDFTVVFTVTGLNSSLNQVGLEAFGPPQVGTNYGDFWVNNGSWALQTNNAGLLGLGMQFNNSPTPAPEPSVLGLGAMGLVMLGQFIRRRKE
jgi:hypothetical protein